MSSYTFNNNGYHYFLVSDGDGFYLLHSDADYLQPLQANEEEPGVITSITNGENTLLTLGQKFYKDGEEKTIKEFVEVKGATPTFKVKIEWSQPENLSGFFIVNFLYCI